MLVLRVGLALLFVCQCVQLGNAVATPTDQVIFTSSPEIRDVNGDFVPGCCDGNTAHAGQPLIISANLTMNTQSETEYLAVLDVLDSNGYTDMIFLHAGTTTPDSTIQIQTTWTPDKPDNYYRVRVFVLSSIEMPKFYGGLTTTNIPVVA